MAPKPFGELDAGDVRALQSLASQLHAAWSGLRYATGDDDALPKLRLSRLFAIQVRRSVVLALTDQDNLVEGAFAISGESVSRLVRTLSLVPELDEVQQLGCTEPKQIGRIIRAHSSAHSIMLAIDAGSLPLTIATLDKAHEILMAEQTLQNPHEAVYLLVRKGHVRRGLCYTAMTERGPGCVAKVYAPGSIVEAEYARLLDLLAVRCRASGPADGPDRARSDRRSCPRRLHLRLGPLRLCVDPPVRASVASAADRAATKTATDVWRGSSALSRCCESASRPSS